MPAKHQNTRQAQTLGLSHHHAHTISRASNINYLNNLKSNQYSNNHLYPFQMYQQQQQQISHNHIAKQQQTNNGSSLANPYSYTNTNYEPQLIGSPINMHKQQHHESLMSTIEHQALLNRPLCRCRVMYLGSSVPHITKNGLHGIQEPLRHLYPEEQFSSASSSNTSVSSSSSAGCQSTSGTTATMAGSQLGGSSAALAGQPVQMERSHHQMANGAGPKTIDISHLSSGLGIDSWLSVWSNGLLLENFDEFGREVKRFFSIESLHYCAAVRFFDTKTLVSPGRRMAASASGHTIAGNATNASGDNLSQTQDPNYTGGDQNNNTIGPDAGSAHDSAAGQQQQPQGARPASGKGLARFLPLDAPLFQCPGMVDANHPPVFAAIMRRTTGIKVLECHAFICRRDAASNALVRCCTQAYADLLAAKRLSLELGSQVALYSSSGAYHGDQHHYGGSRRSRSSRTLHKGGGRRPSSNHSSKQSSWSPYESVTVEATINKGTTTNNNSNKLASSLPLSRANAGDASTEDNSLEVSSEDNYAIISKHHYIGHHQQQHRSVHPASELPLMNGAQDHSIGGLNGTPRGLSSGKTRTDRHRSGAGSRQRTSDYRTKAGSSRSLYPDFMPKAALDRGSVASRRQSAGGSGRDTDKLSHSVDLLELGATCCRPEDGNNRGSVKYSLVSNRHHHHQSRRHSRSMQNLDGPYEFSAAEATRQSQRRRSRPRRTLANRGSATTLTNHADHRRSASFNDISDGGTLTSRHQYRRGLGSSRQGSELTIYKPTAAAAAAATTSSALSSSRQSLAQETSSHRQHQSQTPLLPVINNLDPYASLPAQQVTAPTGDGPRPPAQEAAFEGAHRLYGELASRHQSAPTRQRNGGGDERPLGHPNVHDSGYQLNGAATVSSGRHSNKHSVSGGRRARSSLRRRSVLSGAGYELPPAACLSGPQFNHLAHQLHQSPYGTLGLGPPQQQYYPAPQATAAAGLYHHLPGAYYLPAAAAYHHNPQQHPAAAIQNAQFRQHPAMFGPFLYNGPDPLANLPPGQVHYAAVGPAASGHFGTDRGSKSYSKSSAAKAALASGFRCLSPPMNFLSTLRRQSTVSEASNAARTTKPDSAAAPNGHRLPANGTPAAEQPAAKLPATAAAAAKVDLIEDHRESDAASPDPTTVVSARPGFLASSAATSRDKKMSWIKRLSLTMSSSPDPIQTPNGPALSAANPALSAASQPNGLEQQQQQQRPKKRRSGLFSGSLTIGRKSRQHRQQQNGASKMVAA